jgi:DNA polymerase III gamma/tau subunit
MGNHDLVNETAERKNQMQQQAEGFGVSGITHAIRCFGEAVSSGRASWLPGLPLELALIEAAQSHSSEPVQSSPAERHQEQNPEALETPRPNTEVQQGGSINFNQMAERWKDILAASYQYDPRTQALLNSCKPLGLDKGSLVLGFSSDLLREKMEKGHNLSLVQQALQDVFGVSIDVRCVLADSWRAGGGVASEMLPVEEGGIVATAMQDLGAEVVDIKRLPPES